MNKKLIGIFCFLAVLATCCVYSQDAGKNLDMQSEMEIQGKGFEQSGFRGSNGSSQNCLEDYTYQLDENSLIYSPVNTAVGNKGGSLTGNPQVSWTITNDNDKNDVVSNPSNKTSNPSNFKNPGTYRVHNSGARQVSDAGGAAGTATANQTMGVVVHDVTVPDLWVAFEECVGKDFANSEEELSNKMVAKMIEKLGEPFVTENNYKDEVENTSYIFVDEGSAGQRDKLPEQKTVRYTVCGNLFNEDGVPTLNGDVISTKLYNAANKTQQALVNGGEDNSAFKGVFIRRNVPFIALVRSIDNGDKRKSIGSKASDGVKFTIKDSNGNIIKPDANGGYLFRIPNFPRNSYGDQPDYYFEAEASDVSKNLTKIQAPLYVIDTSASFESTSN